MVATAISMNHERSKTGMNKWGVFGVTFWAADCYIIPLQYLFYHLYFASPAQQGFLGDSLKDRLGGFNAGFCNSSSRVLTAVGD
jgi:hypothetical protein